MKDCGGHFHGKHLKRSLDYVMNPEKTQDGRLIGAINCQVDSAFEQMKATKRKFGKVDIYSNSVDFINEFLQNLPYFRIIIWFLTDKKTDILRIIFKSSSFIRSDDTSASTDPVWESIKISDAV